MKNTHRMEKWIDLYILYVTDEEFIDALWAFYVPTRFYSEDKTFYWDEESWGYLTEEIFSEIKSRAASQKDVDDYVLSILKKLYVIAGKVTQEPSTFWVCPTEYVYSAEKGRSYYAKTDAERAGNRLRNELHRLGAVIEAALLENHLPKDLFFYQRRTFTHLITGIRTSDMAKARSWSYDHALKLTRGLQFLPANILYLPKQEDNEQEFLRSLSIQVNQCAVEEVNIFFKSVVNFFKSGTPFDPSDLLARRFSLKKHCKELASSSASLHEKKRIVMTVLGTLSLCYNSSIKPEKYPEGVKEVYDRYLSIISDVFLHCEVPVLFKELWQEWGIKALRFDDECDDIQDEAHDYRQEHTDVFSKEPYKSAKEYFDVLVDNNILDSNFKLIAPPYTKYHIGWAARFMINNVRLLHYKDIEDLVDIPNLRTYSKEDKWNYKSFIKNKFDERGLSTELPEDKK